LHGAAASYNALENLQSLDMQKDIAMKNCFLAFSNKSDIIYIFKVIFYVYVDEKEIKKWKNYY